MQWAPSHLSPAMTMPEPNLAGPSQENPIVIDDGRRVRPDKATSPETWGECRRYVSIVHAWWLRLIIHLALSSQPLSLSLVPCGPSRS
jgi:hypothetical protein